MIYPSLIPRLAICVDHITTYLYLSISNLSISIC